MVRSHSFFDLAYSSTLGFLQFTTLTVLAGYDDYQIYLLLSCAPVQGHIAGIVDVSLGQINYKMFIEGL